MTVLLGIGACSRAEDPSPPPKPAPARPPSGPSQPPPIVSRGGPVARLDGFMGLSFYPSSEEVRPDSPAGPDAPSVRVTADGANNVAAYYKTRLSNTAKETRKGKTVIVEGRTPAGEVQIVIEPSGGRTQVTMRRK